MITAEPRARWSASICMPCGSRIEPEAKPVSAEPGGLRYGDIATELLICVASSD